MKYMSQQNEPIINFMRFMLALLIDDTLAKSTT